MAKVKTRHAIWMRTDSGSKPQPPPGWTYHVVGWNELPTDVEPKVIERVILSDDRMDAKTPTVLGKLPKLRSISTDTHLVGFAPADLPALEELYIVGTRDVELPRGPWPKLRIVEGRDACVSIASAAEFPALDTLVVRTKGTKRILGEIAKLPKLRELQFGPAKEDTLAIFDGLPLHKLAFNRGSIESLAGVARFPKLTVFGAMNCHDFADLTPLASVSSLEEVWFNTCAGIKKPDALLKMPKLATVTFWGCRDNNGVLKKVCRALEAKGVTVKTELFS